MATNFYRIKIGTKYLTQNGLQSARPCELNVDGIDELRKTVHKTVTQLASGGLDVKNFDYDAVPKPFEIVVETLPSIVGEYLLGLYNNSTVVTVLGTGSELGDINVQAEIVDFTFKNWRTGYWKKVTIKLVTA